MKTEGIGFDIEDGHIEISIRLDRGDGSVDEVCGVIVSAPGVFVIPPELGVSYAEASALRDEAAAYYEARKIEIGATFQSLERYRKRVTTTTLVKNGDEIHFTAICPWCRAELGGGRRAMGKRICGHCRNVIEVVEQ